MDDPAKGVDELSRLGWPGIANVTKETPKNGSCCRANLVTRLGQIKEQGTYLAQSNHWMGPIFQRHHRP